MRIIYWSSYVCSSELSGLWRFVNSSQDEMEIGFAMMATCGLSGLEGKAESLRATAKDAPKQFEAYKSDCIEALNPFEPGKSLDSATSAHDFDFKLLKHEPTTVYLRSDERSVGNKCVSQCRYALSPQPYKNNSKTKTT